MEDEEFISFDDEFDEDLTKVDNSSQNLEKESSKTTSSEEDVDKNKKLYYLLILLSLMIIAMIVAFFYLYIKKNRDKNNFEDINSSQIVEHIKEKKLTPTQENIAQTLLKKAEDLYNKGEKEEALKIYQELSQYNKSLSFYNIGVAKLKEKKYKEAIKSFEHSIKNRKLTVASAINCAVSSYIINDQKNFNRYLKIAQKYLPYMASKPLYSYYYAMIEYYKEEPLESFIAIKHPTSEFNQNEQNIIASKSLTVMENYADAINRLQRAGSLENSFTIGLLQSRLEEFKLAEKSFQNAIEQNINPLKSAIALALVKNREGKLKDSGKILKDSYDKYKDKATNIYPIKVELKKSIFNPIDAQKDFKKRVFLNNLYKYSILFYFAPYKVFSTNKSSKDITKGAKKIEIDSLQPALGYLSESTKLTDVNIAIINGLKKISQNRVYEANKIFKDAVKLYPSHAILHYDLALSYAQIFDFQNAYKEFSKCYSLDFRLVQALCFKSLCAKLTSKEIPVNELNRAKLNTNNNPTLDHLIELSLDSLGLNLRYLNENNPFSEAINLIFSYLKDDYQKYKDSALKLKNLLPRDIVTNILYIDSLYEDKSIKEYARAIQNLTLDNSLNLSPLYNGGFLPKELYIRILNIAGKNIYIKEKLENSFQNEKNSVSFLQTLAYSYIYTNEFEKAYKLYNTLIDKYKQDDSHTLFLAALSAIGSNHHANAVALLELSKLTDKSNLESRYALGLLYQEKKNFEGASIEYNLIGNSNFYSNYFTFRIK